MLLDYTYRYDGNGNRTSKAGASNVSRYAGNDSSIGNTSYSYDSLQRLQEVSYPTGTVEKFAYDNAGNRILKKYGTADNFKTGSYLEERYRYDNKNRLLESRNPQNVTYYQYDKQGNTISELTKRYLTGENKEAQSVQYAAGMTEKQDSIMQELGQQEVQHGNRTLVSHSVEKTELQQYNTYAYNSFNKASKVTVENYTNGEKAVDIHENFYDAENMRYSIKENGTTTNFVTNGWSVFTELDAEWKPTKRLVRGYSIVASEEIGTATITDVGSGYNNGYHYYHQNVHGDIEYITGKDGKVENAYTYDAFGNITSSTELVKNRYTYNGEQYDQVTQQYYLRARYYNPLVGRFTQEDVYRGDGLNLYAYCGSNPVMYVDPSGYAKKCGTGSEGGSGNNDAVKRMNVGDSGHHVPGVRKTKRRTFEVARSDKTRPTIFSTGTDPGYDHWRLHNAERQYVGPRQGDFIGSNDELFDAYRKAYKGLDDIKVDVKSPDGKTVLGKNVTPSKAVDLIQQWLKDNDLY